MPTATDWQAAPGGPETGLSPAPHQPLSQPARRRHADARQSSHADAVRCHIRLARAIRDGDPETAAESASFIVTQAADEVGKAKTEQTSGAKGRPSGDETRTNSTN